MAARRPLTPNSEQKCMDLSKRLDSFELKIRQLGSKLERLRGENADIRAENEILKEELDRRQGVINALKDKLERTHREMNVRETKAEDSDPDRVRQQIDYYLHEIDKCIEWLEQR